MGLKLTKKPVVAVETSEIKNKGNVVSETSKEVEVNVPAELSASVPSAGPFCEVGVDMSYTHNLGNYQSAKVGISIKVPCLHSEVDEVYDFAKTWADTKLNVLVSELQGE